MSTKKRIIFIHLPKCGGNSIKESFAKACKGRSDIEFISIGHMDINYYISDYHKYKYTNREDKDEPLSTFNYFEDPDTLFFTITRNPYRKFISAYYYRLNSDDFFKNKLKDIANINQFAEKLRENYNVVFWRQAWFLIRSNQVKNFKYFQLEKLNTAIDYFKENYDLDLEIDKLNRTEQSENSSLSILNRRTVCIINRWFEEDFDNYGYYKINPETVNETVNETTNETTNESTNETTNETTNESTNETVNETTNETTNETVNETTNETVNETTNETV